MGTTGWEDEDEWSMQHSKRREPILANSGTESITFDEADAACMESDPVHECNFLMLPGGKRFLRLLDFDEPSHELLSAEFVAGIKEKIGHAEHLGCGVAIDQFLLAFLVSSRLARDSSASR